ncbi:MULTISPECIES: MGMT family protein [Planococcus]|uniref:DNA methyltransferase n=1 Tax=Planococcus faecalis TaxID=1598147 RepID=A0ABN4XVF7_9BACL|nr:MULTISPECIES: MGMT family protein [Planococcus]AQU81080.1 DNA methyltransferase [Planococcus faecalis]MDJ0330545.1 MGMT family protein [Planococcus sp. S3-L1]OHX52585.1 DNA methyltransferase [Planococcus faecalis]
MQTFTERALRIIKQIPLGKIMTYGQVAAAAGSPRGARQVTRILHSMSAKHSLPWHRIVNAKGQIVLRNEEARFFQRKTLQEEGVEIDKDDRIDLLKFRFHPIAEEEKIDCFKNPL